MRPILILCALLGMLLLPADTADAGGCCRVGGVAVVAGGGFYGQSVFVQQQFAPAVLVQRGFGTQVIVQNNRGFVRRRANVQVLNNGGGRTVVRQGGLRGLIFGDVVRTF